MGGGKNMIQKNCVFIGEATSQTENTTFHAGGTSSQMGDTWGIPANFVGDTWGIPWGIPFGARSPRIYRYTHYGFMTYRGIPFNLLSLGAGVIHARDLKSIKESNARARMSRACKPRTADKVSPGLPGIPRAAKANGMPNHETITTGETVANRGPSRPARETTQILSH